MKLILISSYIKQCNELKPSPQKENKYSVDYKSRMP